MSHKDDVRDTSDGRGVEEASGVKDEPTYSVSKYAEGLEKVVGKGNPSLSYLENDLEISVSFCTHTRTVKHKAKTSIPEVCNNESKQTKELNADKGGSKSTDTDHVCKYWLFASWFPKFLCFLVAYSITVDSIMSSLINILTRLAKPHRTKGKGKISKGKRTGNFPRKKGTTAMKLRARYTEKEKRDSTCRISANNGQVSRERKKRAKKKVKMKDKRNNPKPVQKLGNTTPSEGYGTEDNSKAVSTSRCRINSSYSGRSPLACPADAIIGLEESDCKLVLLSHEQETNTEKKTVRLDFLTFKEKSSRDFDLDPNTSPKCIGDFDDTNTKEKDISHIISKQSRYFDEQAFQDTHSQLSVVSYCTWSTESDTSDDSLDEDSPSQQLQTAVHSNNEENVISVRESREERNREQTPIIDLHRTRHTPNRVVSIRHQRQLNAWMQQDRNNQRAPVVHLQRERLRRTLMEGPMVDIQEERRGILQYGPMASIHDSHGEGSCCICGSHLGRMWCRDCAACFCVEHDVLHHGQCGRQAHRRQMF